MPLDSIVPAASWRRARAYTVLRWQDGHSVPFKSAVGFGQRFVSPRLPAGDQLVSAVR